MTKGQLPDATAKYPENGSLKDSLEFVLMNFEEMNKLWCVSYIDFYILDYLKFLFVRIYFCL
jgi:hypothetical protein